MRRLLESRDTAAHDLTELPGLDCLAAASMLLAAEADSGGGGGEEPGLARAPPSDEPGDDGGEASGGETAAPLPPLLAAQRLASRAFRSRATFFLVNGTSGGLHAAVAACCADGDALVAPRSCHQSAFAACAVSGAAPVWLAPERQRVGRGGGAGRGEKDGDDGDIGGDGDGGGGGDGGDGGEGDGGETIAHGVTAEQVARAIDAVLMRGPDGEGGEEAGGQARGEAAAAEGRGRDGGGATSAARGSGERPPRAENIRRRGVGAVLITSPTYFGAVAPVREIARECHRRGVPLIVDEAHGAHLAPMRGAAERAAKEAAAAAAAAGGAGGAPSPFAPSPSPPSFPPSWRDDLPEPALWQGADVSVQSAHKTLTALTQAALLHVGDGRRQQEEGEEEGPAAAAVGAAAGTTGALRRRSKSPPLVPAWRVARCLQALQSSSPSYLLTCSLDAARALAFGPGAGRDWARALEGAAALRQGLRAAVPGARLLEDGYGGESEQRQRRRRQRESTAGAAGEDRARGGIESDRSSSSSSNGGSGSGGESSSGGGSSGSGGGGASASRGSVAGWDPLRVAVDVSGLGAGALATGAGAAAWLERERGVVAELAVGPLVVMVWGGGLAAGGGGGGRGEEASGGGGGGNGNGNGNGGGNGSGGGGCSVADAERVVAAFEALAACAGREAAAAPEPAEDDGTSDGDDDDDGGGEGGGGAAARNAPAPREPALAPREALFGAARLPPPLRVPLALAARRRLVSAELLCPYPPGVPEVLPGERLTPGAARRLRGVLRRGGTVSGASDGTLATVLVFAPAAAATGDGLE